VAREAGTIGGTSWRERRQGTRRAPWGRPGACLPRDQEAGTVAELAARYEAWVAEDRQRAAENGTAESASSPGGTQPPEM
jgi:hypothetical protein